jgi:hypothetical protein
MVVLMITSKLMILPSVSGLGIFLRIIGVCSHAALSGRMPLTRDDEGG